ncbi:MAG: hypothetical protein PHX34_00365 [Candidatus Shapirobacteria bacterium]|nr:hypothetical protein [Candidatus Shapirobacteria bacterium]
MGKEVGYFYKKSLDKEPIRIDMEEISQVKVDNRESIISRVSISIENQPPEIMILKSQNEISQKFPECTPEYMFKKYLKLKELGLPVLTDFWVDPENRRFLMTDLSEWVIDKHTKDKLPIVIENLNALKSEAIKFSSIAYQGNVYLAGEAYCIFFDKKNYKGKGRLYTLDFGYGSIIFDQHKDIAVEGFNENYAKYEAKIFGNWISDHTLNLNSTMSSGCII